MQSCSVLGTVLIYGGFLFWMMFFAFCVVVVVFEDEFNLYGFYIALATCLNSI